MAQPSSSTSDDLEPRLHKYNKLPEGDIDKDTDCNEKRVARKQKQVRGIDRQASGEALLHGRGQLGNSWVMHCEPGIDKGMILLMGQPPAMPTGILPSQVRPGCYVLGFACCSSRKDNMQRSA